MSTAQAPYIIHTRYVRLVTDEAKNYGKGYSERLARYMVGLQIQTRGQDDGAWGGIEINVYRTRDGKMLYHCDEETEIMRCLVQGSGDNPSDEYMARSDHLEEAAISAARAAWELRCATEGSACDAAHSPTRKQEAGDAAALAAPLPR